MIRASAEERAAERPEWLVDAIEGWQPPERLGGNDWAETFRTLASTESSSPGKWVSVPWQREILDALADPLLNWIVIQKAEQVGISELVRCAIGRWAVLDPGDTLWVMSTQDKAEGAMVKLRAMFEATPVLRELLSAARTDNTLLEMTLTNGMKIVIAWADSPASTASDPFRRVILDEAAKYKRNVKGQGSAVERAPARVRTFGRRGKVVLLSSPTADDDLICSNFAQVEDRRVFAVPCPACGDVQPIDFLEAGRWPGGEAKKAPTEAALRTAAAREIEATESAWAACRACAGKIQPNVAMKDPRARWVPAPGASPETRRRAYFINEVHHWETSFSALVTSFLRRLDHFQLAGFYMSSLGIPYRADSTPIEAATFVARATHTPKLVPAWASVVIASADTQGDGWWIMLRAWGQGPAWATGGRSRLLDWGHVKTIEELQARTIDARFDVEGDPNVVAPVTLMCVDTGGGMKELDGSRTSLVYSFVAKHPRARAFKGEGSRTALDQPWRSSTVKFSAPVQKGGYGEIEIPLFLVNRSYYADALATLTRGREGEPVVWEECQGAEHPTYTGQMSSMHKVTEISSSGTEFVWKKRSGHGENHLWDCGRYQICAADLARVKDRTEAHWEPRASKVDDEPRARYDTYKIGRR